MHVLCFFRDGLEFHPASDKPDSEEGRKCHGHLQASTKPTSCTGVLVQEQPSVCSHRSRDSTAKWRPLLSQVRLHVYVCSVGARGFLKMMQHNVKMYLAHYMCASIFICPVTTFTCSVQESDSGSYFCRASNVHLQRFVASRRATLTVLGMTSQWTCHMVPPLYLHFNFFFCLSRQLLHQSKYGHRC